MISKISFVTLLLASAISSLPGCAVTDGEANDAEVSDVARDDFDVSESAKKLVGAFQGQGSVRPPSFQGIVFKSDGTFLADVDTGIRCIVAPCPSVVRLEGAFQAGRKFVTLSPVDGPSSTGFYGRYNYALRGGTLTLAKIENGRASSNTFTKERSYCTQPVDCDGQDIIVPACVGRFLCGASTQNRCQWTCGLPLPQVCEHAAPPQGCNWVSAPSGNCQDDRLVCEIWPTSATKLVAKSRGGFTPLPPAGSSCGFADAMFSLETATLKLTAETCESAGPDQPLRLKTVTKVISATEFAAVNVAMNAVTLSTRNICGADAPSRSLEVTTPLSGTKTYLDSFYSCAPSADPYVDNVSGVLSALRTAAQ